jgi:cytochrome c2
VRSAHVALFAACFALAGCNLSDGASADAVQVPGGDPMRGHAILASGAYGCIGCHTVPGVRGARGVVGPPLDGMAARAFVAGQLPNTPDVLLAFLQDPPALVPETGMPSVWLGLQEARDIAAYLYTLGQSNER